MATAYVPLTEAAARLGVSVDTVRRRIRSGELHAQREQRPQGYRWVVALPDDPPAPEVAEVAEIGNDLAPAQVAPMHLQDVLGELVRLREAVQALAAHLVTQRAALPATTPDYIPTVPTSQLIRTTWAQAGTPDTQTPRQSGEDVARRELHRTAHGLERRRPWYWLPWWRRRH
jgi:hypothetical protein